MCKFLIFVIYNLKFRILFDRLRCLSDFGNIDRILNFKLFILFEVKFKIFNWVVFRFVILNFWMMKFILYVYCSFFKFRMWREEEDLKLWDMLFRIFIVSFLFFDRLRLIRLFEFVKEFDLIEWREFLDKVKFCNFE